ncbi:MAG: cell division protein FtsL [Bacilli bacterium]
MKKRTKKKLKMSKFEKLLYTFAIVLAVSFPVVIVFSKATLSKINYDVEEIKKEIETQSKTNEGLNMQIGELASLDKVQEVAKNQGLSYNSSNIKSIEDN